MRVLILAGLMVSVALSGARAQEAAQQSEAVNPVITVKGTIIDNKCAGGQSLASLGEFVKTHTKECALLPECAASGYSIYADGTVYKLDEESSARVKEFLGAPDSKLTVEVPLVKKGEVYNAGLIKNR